MDEDRLHINWDDLERELLEADNNRRDYMRSRGIGIEADRVVSMILDGMARVDIEIAIRSFRSQVLEEFPGKGELFDSLYIGRFRRIWEQFRKGEGGLLEQGY
jgi:hypothetical protein